MSQDSENLFGSSDVAVLPKFPIPGYEHMSVEEASKKLHERRNKSYSAAMQQVDDGILDFPPYRFRPFPTSVYRHWDPAAKRREVMRLAGAQGVSLGDERGMLVIEDSVPLYETRTIGVHDFDADDDVMPRVRDRNEEDLRLAIGQGWATTPDGVKAAERRINDAIANAAAERTYDDRHLGELGRRELDAIEAASDVHVVEVPQAKPGGRRKD